MSYIGVTTPLAQAEGPIRVKHLLDPQITALPSKLGQSTKGYLTQHVSKATIQEDCLTQMQPNTFGLDDHPHMLHVGGVRIWFSSLGIFTGGGYQFSQLQFYTLQRV